MLRLDPGEDEEMGIKEEDEDEEDEGEEEEEDDYLVADERAALVQPAVAGGRRSRAREEKERTKLRERQRRAVTARILAGLRRHGNYSLRVRADINEVVAALAREAGWVVLPDGTTFPSSSCQSLGDFTTGLENRAGLEPEDQKAKHRRYHRQDDAATANNPKPTRSIYMSGGDHVSSHLVVPAGEKKQRPRRRKAADLGNAGFCLSLL